MTTFDTIIQLLSMLLPSVSVLVFLLLHRRQRIRADLEAARLHQDHHLTMAARQTERSQALASMASSFAPVLMQLVERVTPSRPSAAALSDEDLVAELDQRIHDRGWKHGNPFAELDDLLERLWSEGVEVPPPAREPANTEPDIPPQVGSFQAADLS